ncbi:MAG: DivIVA domain-containing protein [Clostridia bacterium]|nr:DivIVA domain-containing protein [Clostridia bacterium]
MITPLDIQTIKFASSPMGYKKAEVDEFLQELLKNYERLYKNSNESSEKIKALTKQLETYKGIEETMKNTLVVAQSSAEQLTAAARNEAEAIVAEANIKSKEILAKAADKLNALTVEYDALKKEISLFVMRSKAEFELRVKELDKTAEAIDNSSI